MGQADRGGVWLWDRAAPAFVREPRSTASTWGGTCVRIPVFFGGPDDRQADGGDTDGATAVGLQQANLDAYWTYDNEGRVLSVQYPVVYDPNTGDPTSTAYNYTYDTMGRPSTMPTTMAFASSDRNLRRCTGVQYNASDQIDRDRVFRDLGRRARITR